MEIFDNVPFAVTICDIKGIIIYMNKKSAATFANDGGEKLVGKPVYNCHPPHVQAKIKDMMAQNYTNAYTITKNGQKKMIFQSPWLKNGIVAGLIELSMVIPNEMPHYDRK